MQRTCSNCSLQSEQITDGQFNCLTENTPDQVTYRANLRGNTDSDCDDIVEIIETWVQSARASITIQGSSLTVASNCEVAVDTLTSPLDCISITTMEETTGGVSPSESPVPIALVAGAAGGGILALIVISVVLIVIVSLLTTARRRKRKRCVVW